MKKSSPKILITAGPTREYLDPVRYLSNESSGAMGFALAAAFVKEKFSVQLVCGPTSLKPPKKVKTKKITTARQMHQSVMKFLPKSNVFISTAAVSDYRFKFPKKTKVKKKQGSRLQLALVKNPDILKEVGQWKRKHPKKPLRLIGFALETKDVKKEAKRKLREKNLDLIIGNTPASFSNKSIQAYWLERGKKGKRLGKVSKKDLAKRIVAWIKK